MYVPILFSGKDNLRLVARLQAATRDTQTPQGSSPMAVGLPYPSVKIIHIFLPVEAYAPCVPMSTPLQPRWTSQARFPFKLNRLRCVNENRKKRKRLRWQAANHCCHCFYRAFLLAGAFVCFVKISRNKRKRQSIGILGRSSGNHDWLLANASDCVWMETRLYTGRDTGTGRKQLPRTNHLSFPALIKRQQCHCNRM